MWVSGSVVMDGNVHERPAALGAALIDYPHIAQRFCAVLPLPCQARSRMGPRGELSGMASLCVGSAAHPLPRGCPGSSPGLTATLYWLALLGAGRTPNPATRGSNPRRVAIIPQQQHTGIHRSQPHGPGTPRTQASGKDRPRFAQAPGWRGGRMGSNPYCARPTPVELSLRNPILMPGYQALYLRGSKVKRYFVAHW